jgi:transposase-like protein|tara:strand:- start:949 stop:1845 length:897 start_codon:yes stop_codon:yes gene_type:complete
MRAVCPSCASSHTRKKGIRRNKQRWTCNECRRQFTAPIDYTEYGFPKILLFDVETSFYHFVGWGTYKQYIQHYQITEHQYIISWAAKWLYDDNVQSDVVTSKESKNRDDKRILKSIWKLLDEADIVIGHNGDRFDLRKLRWRFISEDMQPPSPFRVIDTLKIARREFFAPSYKQDFLTKYFHLQNKLETNFQLWKDCEAGIPEKLEEMVEYNRHDVMGLEELYLKIRPYIHNHPNLGVLMDKDVCSTCGADDIVETNSEYITSANKFPVYRCNSCKTPHIRHKKNSNEDGTNIRSVSS